MARRRYHQTREDRRHESEGMRGRHRSSHGSHRYSQTREDRRHESEGMRDRSRGTHRDAYHQTERDREDEARGMRGRHRSSHGSHQTERDRMDESRGMSRRYGDDRRGSSRRYHEMDSAYEGMIHEDHYAPANLPQEVKMDYYPKQRWLPEDINDTITRVDDDIDDSIYMLREYESKTMY